MNAIVPRETIEQICAKRDRAVSLYEAAFTSLEEAQKLARDAAFGNFSSYERREDRLYNIEGGKDAWTKNMRQAIDRGVWQHLFVMTDIERLMDSKAKEEFHRQLREDPIPATPENCMATIMGLMGQADVIFKRGIANIFTKLDRRFRSHDGFKIGRRIILDNAFSDTKNWNYWKRADDTLRDIERTFRILEGLPQPEQGLSFPALLMTERRKHSSLSEFQGEYFKMRWFRNGNAHLWFMRPDLLKKVNLLLAEYYGETLGDSRQDETPTANRALVKNLGFFETPKQVVEKLMERASLWKNDEKPFRILEPSAGLGRIAFALADNGETDITAVEFDASRAHALKASGKLAKVLNEDFLDMKPADLGAFDRILMNPPFGHQSEIDHVLHAWNFLAPGGVLVSVMPSSAEFSETKKALYFQNLVTESGGSFIDLPAGSFQESGTMINTAIVIMNKKSRT